MEIAPGVSLGPYEVLDRLGRGGMGEVFSARDSRLDRTVAIKVLPAELADDPASRDRLVKEAKAAASLSHPSICTLYEVGEYQGLALIAMEHISGSTLAKLIGPAGMPMETALRYGMQIAGALAHAHDHGIIHRDLKCNNIMVTPEGLAKVVDFGLARRLEQDDIQELTRSTESMTTSGAMAGTLAYMAPEVLGGKPADLRSDIWALGVVLHVMVSGALPFAGETPFELAASILREPAPPLPITVLPGLRTIVHRCLAKDAMTRYQRAGEVAAALESAHEDAAALGEALPPRSRPFQQQGGGGPNDPTLAMGSSAPAFANSATPLAGDSQEIQALNRIAGALNPVVIGTKILVGISVGAVVLALLGLVTSATFDLALHVPIEGTALDYLIFGVRAVIPTVVLMIIDVIAIVALVITARLLFWLIGKVRHRDHSIWPGKGVLRLVRRQLDEAAGTTLLSWLGALSVVAIIGVALASWPQLRAIEQLVEQQSALPVDTTALSPSAHRQHFLASWVSATTLLLLGSAWLLGLSTVKRQDQTGTVPNWTRAIGFASMFAIATLTVVPWRTLWANERERIALDGHLAFIVSEAEERLYLYAPHGGDRFLDVAVDDARVQRKRDAKRENIFAEP
jgi:serine/threonine protein kinase